MKKSKPDKEKRGATAPWWEPSGSIPMMTLRDIVIFPGMVIPLFVGREKSIKALNEANIAKKKLIFLAAQKDAQLHDPKPGDIFETGGVAEILQVMKLADGNVKILVEGLNRGRITKFITTSPYFEVEFDALIDPPQPPSLEDEALVRQVTRKFEDFVKLSERMPPETAMSMLQVADISQFSDVITTHLPLKSGEKQKLVELIDPRKRLEEVFALLVAEIEVLKIEKRVRGRVKKQMERNQKEYYLTEQMKAIQKELGRSEDIRSEAAELEDRIRKSGMPEETRNKALKELRKLEQMPPLSAEGTVVRNYLDWLLDLPWDKRSDDKLDQLEAEKILDEDHYGLVKVKERILEYLAVRQLAGSKSAKGSIICFVGPPGVGKTSLGKSIARAMNRKFVRMSLGGVRDEAEIRGHRRTYVGSMPGRIIQSIKKAGMKNPVMLLDEVDKLGTDYRGDPSSALLEVLDPEQNSTFNDHYLEVDFDLSEAMFIATANMLDTIPRPLQDRMEIIRIPGYTEEEKVRIARQFLVPKTLAEHGLSAGDVELSPETILDIVRKYTRESGVRNLEREISKIWRKVARETVKSAPASGHAAFAEAGAGHETGAKTVITPAMLEKYLGVEKHRFGKIEEANEPGFANGLAWTELGGEMLPVEVSVVDGSGKVILTGKLGDIMKESAHAALTYIRSRRSRLGLARGFHKKVDIHIHLPEGAIPKDGPSAGITMCAALVSALTGIPIKNSVAMTGEITLRGKVLPIGGLKEKLLAAKRGGVTDVIIPGENMRDLAEIRDMPGDVMVNIAVRPVESMDDVLSLVMSKPFRSGRPVRHSRSASRQATIPAGRAAKSKTRGRLRPPLPIN